MFKPVGYLRNTKEGITGERGTFYDYIFAENGILIDAHSDFIKARINTAPAMVRGLEPLDEYVELVHGKIPWRLYELALNVCLADIHKERYLAIVWNCGYEIKVPEQQREEARVNYEVLPSTVMDIHSHGTIPAGFSGTDNRDETGMKLYMVFGSLQEAIPEFRVRVGVYGYFMELEKEEVFG